jgi:peptidyl-prolyl cis-trans isomerase A (cyclophilin A)
MTSTRLLLPLTLAGAVTACDSPAPAPGAPTTSAPAAAAPSVTATPEGPKLPPLLDPKSATAKAPDRYRVAFDTTKGRFVVEVTRALAPTGADRFYNLVKIGFYQDMALFRVVKDFVVQWGIHGDPKVSQAWREAYIMDEMTRTANKRGTVTFAKGQPDTRTTAVFINLKDNSKDLDDRGFPPFGTVVEGMDVVDSLYNGYGEHPQMAAKQIMERGNALLKEKFPKLDYIKSTTLL